VQKADLQKRQSLSKHAEQWVNFATWSCRRSDGRSGRQTSRRYRRAASPACAASPEPWPLVASRPLAVVIGGRSDPTTLGSLAGVVGAAPAYPTRSQYATGSFARATRETRPVCWW